MRKYICNQDGIHATVPKVPNAAQSAYLESRAMSTASANGRQQTVLKARATSSAPASQHRSVLCPASIQLRNSGEPLKWGGVQGPGGVADGAGDRLPAEPGHRCTHAALRTPQQALRRLLLSFSSFQGVLSPAPLLFTHPPLSPEVKTVRPLVQRAGSPPFP